MKVTDLFVHNIHLLTTIVITLLFFGIFYPQFYTSTDEREYIENSYYLLYDSVEQQNQECFDGAYCGYFNGEGYVSKYNIGLSILLIPFMVIGWQSVFILTLLFFTLAIIVFSYLLRQFKIPQWFLYLFALFPPFIYYSHKILSEIPSMAIVLLLMAIFLRAKKSPSVALLISFSIIASVLIYIRYTNVLVLLVLVPSILWTLLQTKYWKGIMALLLTAIPFIILLGYINLELYGGILSSGYSLSGEELLIEWGRVPKQLLWYSGILILLYPLMIPLSFFSKKPGKQEIFFIFILYFLFYVGFPGYEFDDGVLSFIFGIRFFIPILGVLMLYYFESVHRLYTRFIQPKLRLAPVYIFFIVFALLINAVAMNIVFAERLAVLKSESNNLYNQTTEGEYIYTDDIENRKLINDGFEKGKRWIFFENPSR